jgi:hydrogenase-4 component E
MIAFANQDYDVAHMLEAGVLVLSFLLLTQRRLMGVIRIYAFQAFTLACASAWQAHIQDASHLYVTAAIALIFKAIIIPIALYRIITSFDIHRSLENVLGISGTILIGGALVGLSILLVFPITASAGALTREGLAIALSVVLLSFLMMITRRNAISQVVGFMSLENGLILAAVSVKGMPLVVELSIAFSVMVAFIIFGVFFFHIRERFDTLDVHELGHYTGERHS